MPVSATLIKLKDGSQEKVDAWANTINARMNEVVAALEDESVDEEAWFQVSLADGDYLLLFMREDDPDGSRDVAAQSKHNIDAFHNNFKRETWIRGSQIAGRLLVDAVRK